jgi:hypothetical protein
MKKAIVFIIIFILSIIATYVVIFVAVKFYNFLSFPENLQSLFGIIFFILSVLLIIRIISKLIEKIMPFSTKEGALYERIKKHFPDWSEVTMSNDYLFISWKSRVKNITHNYKFDFSLNEAKFYNEGEDNKIIFEGAIEKSLVRLK